MTLAGILFAFPYCFNMKKVFALKIVTGILSRSVMSLIIGIALVALQMNYLSDVIFAGVLQFWFAAIVGKKNFNGTGIRNYLIFSHVFISPPDGHIRKFSKQKVSWIIKMWIIY